MQSSSERNTQPTDPGERSAGPTGPTEKTDRTKRRLSSILGSVVFHSSVLALVLMVASAARHRQIQPEPHPAIALLEIAGASHTVKIPLPPSNFAAHTRTPTRDTEATHKTILPVEPVPNKMTGGGKPTIPHAGDGSGLAQSGNGSDNEDARPAFPVFAPRPPISDRSLLPATEAKVVIDVDLDALGQVLHETLVHSVSNKLDQLCMDAVRSWRFQPATVNGKPVPSQAEVVFPFTQDYPIAAS